MKKNCIIILLVIIGCFFVSANSIKAIESNFSVPSEFDTSKNYEITFWAKNDTNITQKKIYQKAIDDFEELYPNIKITLKSYNDYGKIYNDVITNIATNTTPNVCITYPDHIATYLSGNDIVVPLDNLMNDEKYGFGGSEILFDSVTSDEMIEKFMDECKLNGLYYAVPFMRSTEACYINKDYVEKLGYEVPDILTWDFIWEVSEAAMQKDASGLYLVNGQNTMIPFIYKSTDNMMISMLKQQDAGYSTSDGDILIFNETTKEILKTVALHAKSKCFSTFKISSYPGNYFNKGQCIFAIDSTAGATWMGTNAPLLDIDKESVLDFETVVRAIPQYDVDNPKMISQGPSICIFNKEDSQEVLASWLFVQYLLTNDVQIAYSQTEGYAPVTKKAQASDEYKDYLSRCGEDNDLYYDVKISASKLLLDNIDNTFVTPVFNGSTSLRDAAGQMIEEVVKSTNKKQEVNDKKIKEIFSNVISLYRLDKTETDLGKLPKTAVILLCSIGGAWVLIGAYVVFEKIKNKKNYN